MLNFAKYRDVAKEKPVIGKMEFVQIITAIENEYKNEMMKEGRFINIGKVYRPKELARYDIITSMVCGSAHPCMIYKIDDIYVYGVCFSSSEAAHNIYEFKKSRIFSNSYMTNTLVRQTKEEALAHFVGIFDNRIEADLAFTKLKNFYKDVFKL